MTMALDKYDGKQLASLRTDQTIVAVDKLVRNMFQELEAAVSALREAVERLELYDGGNAGVQKFLIGYVRKARGRRDRAASAINGYIEEQRLLMKEKGLNPDIAYTWAIVPVVEDDKTKFRMVKRGLSLEPTDTSDSSDDRGRICFRLPSASLSTVTRRGRYNDGELLFALNSEGIDRSEYYNEEQ